LLYLRLGLKVFVVKIGGVEFPRDLPHFQLAMSYPLLNPQAGALKVPEFAYAWPAADADCC
jgi:hypothetical protein